jgi:ParB family chromosome partitioning protein
MTPPAPSGPRLDPVSAPSEPAPAKASPPETRLPLSLPAGPVTMLGVADLRPARLRSRRSGDPDAAIAALAASVAVQGVREPILARRLAENGRAYQVVAGERRRLAAERAGRADLPAVVVEADDAEALMLSLAENLGRRDFSPLDEGRAYLRLLTEFRVNPAVLAQRVARERSHIVLALRLLGLPETVRRMIDSGRLTPAQAYVLLGTPDPAAMAVQIIEGASPGAARDPA